jgi:hypothetical protein
MRPAVHKKFTFNNFGNNEEIPELAVGLRGDFEGAKQPGLDFQQRFATAAG